jgi:hypothetical protein
MRCDLLSESKRYFEEKDFVTYFFRNFAAKAVIVFLKILRAALNFYHVSCAWILINSKRKQVSQTKFLRMHCSLKSFSKTILIEKF